MKGLFAMSEKQVATLQFWIQLGALLLAAIGSWFALSAKADSAIAQIEELKPRVSAMESNQVTTKDAINEIRTDVRETKTDIKWMVKHMEERK